MIIIIILTGTCEDLPSITNADISYSSTSPRTDGSTATYSCGMVMVMVVGDSIRTCGSDRSWSGTEPFCQSQFSYTCVTNMFWCHIVFLKFRGSTIASASFRVQLDTIGEGVGGLVCRTDHPQCCSETSNSTWLTPNTQTLVMGSYASTSSETPPLPLVNIAAECQWLPWRHSVHNYSYLNLKVAQKQYKNLYNH